MNGKTPKTKQKKKHQKNLLLFIPITGTCLGTCGFNLHTFATFNCVLKNSIVNLSRLSSTLT